MKKCKALGLAFLLFSFTVLVIHLGITKLDFTGPSFDAWVNDDKLLNFSYRRYLNNALRNAFTFKGTPIRLEMRSKDAKDYEM